MTIEELDELIKTCVECYSKAKNKKVVLFSESTSKKQITTYHFRYYPDPSKIQFKTFELIFPTRQELLDVFDGPKDMEELGKRMIQKIHLNVTSLDRQD